MKNSIKTTLIALLLLITATQSSAYVYTFCNHTEEQIAIAIKFREENEPLYTKLIHPHTTEALGDGNGGVPEIKEGYCLTYLYYIKAPTTAQKKHNFATAPWKDIAITWAPLDIYHPILEIVSPHPIPVKKHKVLPAHINYQALSALIHKIHKPAHHPTMCVARHMDIIEDQHGKIFFISPLVEIHTYTPPVDKEIPGV